MSKGTIRFFLLLALAIGVIFAVPALASAHYVVPSGSPTHHPCYGYKCPTGKPSASASASASPSKSTTPTASPSGTHAPTTAPAGPTTPPAGALPVTGAKTDWLVGGGVLLAGLGVGGVVYGRRRRTRFEA
jgi:LPXTG-motif cell wall-anchored protein